jgi:hypothetical protein
MGDEVKQHGFKPSVAKAKVRDVIQAAFPTDNAVALLALPSQEAMRKNFSNKRKHTKIDDFDPLSPPPQLFASYSFNPFNLKSRLRRSLATMNSHCCCVHTVKLLHRLCFSLIALICKPSTLHRC